MYDFIINPAARSGMGKRTWKKVKKILLKHQIDFREFYTKGAGDAGRIAAKVTSGSMPVHLVLIGGDGTLHEMVSGIKNWQHVSVGYIPVGSGNDFARGMGGDLEYGLWKGEDRTGRRPFYGKCRNRI